MAAIAGERSVRHGARQRLGSRSLGRLAAAASTVALVAACSGDDPNRGGDGSGTGGVGPTCTDCTPVGTMVYSLPAPAGASIWTATTMDKVLREASPPTATGDGIQMFAAKNEFEPFQLVLRADAGGAATLSLSAFQGPSSIARVELQRVGYVNVASPSDPGGIPSSRIPDPLEPTSFGAAETLPTAENQPFWITVYVPPDAAAGDYTATLTVSLAGGSVDIPVGLHVFDFALPAEIGFDGNWNGSQEALGGGESLEKVEQIKNFFFEHRLVPSGVAWPAGLNYNGGIGYDCATGTFTGDSNPYDFSQLGPKYIDGTGWNGVGFPSFEIMQFVDNSTPRPQTFCGVDRGSDPFGTAEYNAEWSKLLAAIDAYLVARNWQQKGYYYVQNEPQNQADYDVAAFLADLTKTAAPNLRIAISEEPKAEIAEHPSANGHGYDLWWANLSNFDPAYAAVRQAAGDAVWWYFLYGDLPPHFNPTTIDHPGIESRIGHWAAWKYRIRGFAYYSLTGWGNDPYADPRPQGTNQNGDGFLLYPPVNGQIVESIRWALLREGVEDWEYLRLAAAGNVPVAPGGDVGCDASALQHLRNELGAYLGGERNGCPLLDSTLPGAHPRAAYYINFQDPNGPPASPLTVGGQEWIPIGWQAYDAEQGFGWSGPYIGDSAIMLYSYLADAPVDELQRSIIYDDYGRTDTFNWDIENGRYLVTVSIGFYDRDYAAQRVVVEGQVLFDNAATTVAQPYLVSSVTVDVADGNVTLEVGQFNEYTMLNWLSIEPAN
jgi:hypothetical protein